MNDFEKKEYMRLYYIKNKKAKREYYQSRKDIIKKYYMENKELIKRNKSIYRLFNVDKINNYRRKYYNSITYRPTSLPPFDDNFTFTLIIS